MPSALRPVIFDPSMNTLPTTAVSPSAPMVPTRATEVCAFTPWVK